MRRNRRRAKKSHKGTVNLVVAWRKGKGYEFGAVMTADDVTNDLGALLDQVDSDLAEKDEVEYSFEGDVETDEYMVAPLEAPDESSDEEAHPRRGRQPTSISVTNPLTFRNALVAIGGMDEVGAEDLLGKPIAFYAVIRGTDEEDRVAYIRHQNPMRMAKTGNRFLEFGETLTRLASPIFVMDDKFDLIVRADEIVINDVAFFQSLFYTISGIDEQMDQMVEKALADLDIDEETGTMLVELCRARKRYKGKLAKIIASGHMKDVDMDHFRAALRLHGLPAKRFIRNGAIHAAEKDGGVLLSILNQDLFKGCLTGDPFTAGSKRKTTVA